MSRWGTAQLQRLWFDRRHPERCAERSWQSRPRLERFCSGLPQGRETRDSCSFEAMDAELHECTAAELDTGFGPLRPLPGLLPGLLLLRTGLGDCCLVAMPSAPQPGCKAAATTPLPATLDAGRQDAELARRLQADEDEEEAVAIAAASVAEDVSAWPRDPLSAAASGPPGPACGWTQPEVGGSGQHAVRDHRQDTALLLADAALALALQLQHLELNNRSAHGSRDTWSQPENWRAASGRPLAAHRDTVGSPRPAAPLPRPSRPAAARVCSRRRSASGVRSNIAAVARPNTAAGEVPDAPAFRQAVSSPAMFLTEEDHYDERLWGLSAGPTASSGWASARRADGPRSSGGAARAQRDGGPSQQQAAIFSTVVITHRDRGSCGDVGHSERCAICFESFKEGELLRLLPCMHKYHRPCVDRWLLNSSACPVCKHIAAGR